MNPSENSPTAARAVLSDLLRSAGPLFLISVFYRIIACAALTPLVSGLAGLFLAVSGRMVASNEEIAAFLLEPLGWVAVIVIAAVSLTLIALEQACLMTLAFEASQGAVPRVLGALRFALGRGLAILNLAGRIVLRILLISVPFVALAGLIYLALPTEHDINYYLATRPPAFKWALVGLIVLGIGFAAALIAFTVRVVFSLPIVLFEASDPRMALGESGRRSKGHRLQLAIGIAIWGVIAAGAAGISTALFVWLGRLLTPMMLGHTLLLMLVIGGLFLAFSLVQLLVSIATTTSFSLLVMHWYRQRSGAEKISEVWRQAGGDYGRQDRFRISRRALIGGALLSLVAAAVTGWMLLSNADLEDRTEVAAHRGASNAAPENTLAAVERAIRDGAHWVEIDVQRTADGQVVVVHDRDLMKIGGKPLVVAETRFAELSRVDVGSWFGADFADQRIPSLGTVLDRCKGRIKVNIELKYYGRDDQLGAQVIQIVEDAGMVNDIVIMSLSYDAVRQVKNTRPKWQVGLLSAAALGDLTRLEVDFLAVHSNMVTPDFVRRVHSAGKTLQVWTVNDLVGMTRFFGMGVDAIITDEPARAVRLLVQRAEMDPVERLLVTAGLLVTGKVQHVDPMTDAM